MAFIHVDGKRYSVDGTANLLQVCLGLGFDLPYFCWHPALGSVGACRQCAVKQFKDEDDEKGRIVMACMTPAADGSRISIIDPEARDFRASVIEWLMTNHPHDCPVCEEGGECHLQDMTLMTGHTHRRYRFAKRTHRNQYLGPFIEHEMNRCIACYRCVRFYREYAGGDDLDVFGAHNHVYFGRHADGVLENEFSGNLVEVCPTGVFTDKTLSRHYTRKWDLQTAPSLCVHCGLGCNTSPGERYGRLKRIVNRYHGQVNGYFLCDRGRFGYDFVNADQRVREPLRRRGGKLQPIGGDEAIAVLAALSSGNAIGIGSPRASLEANFALRALVGKERFFQGSASIEHRLIASILDVIKRGPSRSPSLRDVERADAVLVLGEDITNSAPRLALSLRQALRNRAFKVAADRGIPQWQDAAVRDAAQGAKSPLFVAAPHATRLDDVATRIFYGAPDDLARLGFAVAHELDPRAPVVEDLADETRALARDITEVFKRAERPLVVSGTGCGSEALIRAAANVAWALDADLCFAVPECNSLGLGLMGGGDLEAALRTVHEGVADTLIVLENDLYRRAEKAAVDAALEAARHVVVIDHLFHDTTAKSDLVLPAGTFAESDGTLVSSEGRAQRFFQVFVPPGEIRESWRWLRDALKAAGRDPGWRNLDDVTAACEAELSVLQGITRAAPPADYRVAGMRISREPHRYSGRTAMNAAASVHEPKPPQDPDSPLAFSMEGYHGSLPSALLPYVWAPGWNSAQAVNKFQDEIAGSLCGGEAGVRLIEPSGEAQSEFYERIPDAFRPRDGQWLIVPLHHIFGSEELSALAPAVAERSPRPYLALNPKDAEGLGIDTGDEIDLRLNDQTYRLPLTIRPTLPPGVAGLHGLTGTALPAWAEVTKKASLPPSGGEGQGEGESKQ